MFRHVICLLFFFSSDLVLASGEVIKCSRSPKTTHKMKCLVAYKEEMKLNKPSQVIVKDHNGYWVATGKITRTLKNGVIGIFSSSDPIMTGYEATFKTKELQNVIEYNSAFN